MRTFAQKQSQSQRQVSSSSARPNIATSTPGHRNQPIDHLQLVLGNQALQRVLGTAADAPEAGLTDGHTLSATATDLIQRKPEDADKPQSPSPDKKEDKKAELEFHSVMGFPDIVIVRPDDLKGSTFRIYPEEDKYFVIGWRVWNTGWKMAPSHHNRLTIYDAKDCAGCRRPEDLVYSRDSLAFDTNAITQPGKHEYEESFSIDGLPAGHYEAFGELDVNNEVDEINEDNNTQSMIFDVKPVDKPKPKTDVKE